ncbi:MAG: sigma-70 family RNA polymerase sigma factor [Magnetococcus sp. YQC-3]
MSNLTISERIFLDNIMSIPIISAQEELELAIDYYENKNIESAKKLVNSKARMVLKIANKYGTFAPVMDLFQEGFVGLMIAIQKFNPYKNIKFSTYSVWWVKERIFHFLGFFKFSNHKSLNEVINEEELLNLIPEPRMNPEEFLDATSTSLSQKRKLASALSTLNERELNLIKLKYFEEGPFTIEKAIQVVGDVSRQRINVIEKTALNKMKQSIGEL